MSRAIRGLYRRYATSGEYTWYIDKCIKRVGRLCESTATADRDEAERYLLHRIRELRDIAIYGVRPRRKFHEAAAKYLADFADKKHHPPGRRGAKGPVALHWRPLAGSNRQRLFQCVPQGSPGSRDHHAQCQNRRRPQGAEACG